MKANETLFQNFIKEDIQIRIPIYQREYSWQKEQWKELLEDIVEIGADENRSNYFVGSIVYKREDGVIGSVSNIEIIDGQQRITTLTLLLCALLKCWKDIDDESKHDITNFVRNNDFKGTRKLFLRSKDDIILEKIFDNVIHDKEFVFDENDSINVNNAFNYFEKELNKNNPKIIWNGIKKLSIISVLLQDEDRSQAIFESLNSTGKALSNSDLIRNYVLMDSKDSEMLYKKYWSIIESRFTNVAEKEFDEFIRNYLMVKLEKNVTIPNVYKEFKHLRNLKYDEDIECLVQDISKYSKYYINMFYGKEEDKDLKKVFDSLKELKYGVVYRFLLGVYDDYVLTVNGNSNVNLSKDDFIQIVKYVESYVFRRYISGLDPNTMNNFFLSLRKNIDAENYLNSFIANMLQYNNASKRRFPSDDEFKESLRTRNVYKKPEIRNHLLWSLEKVDNNEPVYKGEKIQVEHIMPQHLSKEWQKELGENYLEIHEMYLHTIGNLTLTGYNPEMSNKSFHDKKKEGFSKSNINLNKYFKNIEKWDEEEINKRRIMLFEDVKKLWKYPIITDEIKNLIELKKETQQDIEYTIEDLFNIGEEDEKTQARILYNMLSDMVLGLDENISEKFNKYYIAYKTKNNKNFLKLSPQKQGLKISLAINYEDIIDSKGLFTEENASLPTKTLIKDEKDIFYVFNIIKQVYNNF